MLVIMILLYLAFSCDFSYNLGRVFYFFIGIFLLLIFILVSCCFVLYSVLTL